MQKISILVDPLWDGKYLLSEPLRRLAQKVLQLVSPAYRRKGVGKYRGHPAVTRSLVEGLTTAGLPFNYAPKFTWQLADTVVVLSGPRPLAHAIELKRRGKIKRLFAGPTIVSLASDHKGLIAAPEIDGVIVAGDWVVDLFAQDFPDIRRKAVVWPAGVDTDVWRPIDRTPGRNVLVFEKPARGEIPSVSEYISHLRDAGYNVTLLTYGTYTLAEYRSLLQNSDLMVGFSRHETQGIAWAEAWATDTPTLIWFTEDGRERGRAIRSSPAPYLSPENGAFFVNLDDFKNELAVWELDRSRFQPRKWTLENMSDEVCARDLYGRVTNSPARR